MPGILEEEKIQLRYCATAARPICGKKDRRAIYQRSVSMFYIPMWLVHYLYIHCQWVQSIQVHSNRTAGLLHQTCSCRLLPHYTAGSVTRSRYMNSPRTRYHGSDWSNSPENTNSGDTKFEITSTLPMALIYLAQVGNIPITKLFMKCNIWSNKYGNVGKLEVVEIAILQVILTFNPHHGYLCHLSYISKKIPIFTLATMLYLLKAVFKLFSGQPAFLGSLQLFEQLWQLIVWKVLLY